MTFFIYFYYICKNPKMVDMKRLLLIITALMLLASCSTLNRVSGQKQSSGNTVQTTFLGCTYGDSFERVKTQMETQYNVLSFKSNRTLLMVRGVQFAGFDWDNVSFHFNGRGELMGVSFKSLGGIFDTLLTKLSMRYGKENFVVKDNGHYEYIDEALNSVSLYRGEKSIIYLDYCDGIRFMRNASSQVSEL